MLKETYCLGDIHGSYLQLKEVFKKCNPTKGSRIICLGDYCDRGFDTYNVVEYLMSLKQDYIMVFLRGNHCNEFFKGLETGNYSLMSQGCDKTIRSYIHSLKLDKTVSYKMSETYTDFSWEDMPIDHYNFFKNLLYYYIDEDNNLFIHGGFNRHKLIEEEKDKEVFLWDRSMWLSAIGYKNMKNNEYFFKIKNNFKEVFIGHTPTLYYESSVPINAANIWCVDTGAGKGGLLTMMDINTKEIWQC